MSNTYTPSSTWTDTIEVPATTDPVTGGVGGAANVGNEDNADRAQWLYDQRFEDIKDRVENESGGQLTIREDDLGHWDVFYVLKAFKPSWLAEYPVWDAGNIHRAFTVSAGSKNQILVSLFPARSTTIDGTATMVQAVNLAPSTDTVANLRTWVGNKGTGYHIMTCYEYGALCMEAYAVSQRIHGNTDSGRFDVYATVNDQERGQHLSAVLGTYTVPGSGPLSWRHNNTPWGICDLIGNYPEFIEGIKTVGGQIVMMGLGNYYDVAESSWVNTGVYYNDDGSGNLVLGTTIPTSLTITDDWQDITLTGTLLAAGNSYAGSPLVDAMISPQFEEGATANNPPLLANGTGQVVLSLNSSTEENYYLVGGDYNDQSNAGGGARYDFLTSSSSATCRYVLVE